MRRHTPATGRRFAALALFNVVLAAPVYAQTGASQPGRPDLPGQPRLPIPPVVRYTPPQATSSPRQQSAPVSPFGSYQQGYGPGLGQGILGNPPQGILGGVGGIRYDQNGQPIFSGPLQPFAYQTTRGLYGNRRPGNQFPANQQVRYGYGYVNGLFGRSDLYFYTGWGQNFWSGGGAYFPCYYPFYQPGLTYLSPYAYYGGVLPAFIGSNVAVVAPPQYVYVPVPVYVDGRYQGWRRDELDDYYLNRDRSRDQERRRDDGRNREESNSRGDRQEPEVPRPAPEERRRSDDPEAERTATDIERAWRDRDVQLLSRYVRSDSKIAVYLRGKYQYSLESVDYLDMTRDAFRATSTVRFSLDKIQRKQKGVYLLTGRHTFRDKEGDTRTVLISYVLEADKRGQYALTQVGTSPDSLEREKEALDANYLPAPKSAPRDVRPGDSKGDIIEKGRDIIDH